MLGRYVPADADAFATPRVSNSVAPEFSRLLHSHTRRVPPEIKLEGQCGVILKSKVPLTRRLSLARWHFACRVLRPSVFFFGFALVGCMMDCFALLRASVLKASFFPSFSKSRQCVRAAGTSFWYLVFFLQDKNMNVFFVFFFKCPCCSAYIQATNYLLDVG